MIIENTFIKDLILITPNVFTDERGYFMEFYNQKKIEKVIKTKFIQDNESLSHKDVLRGLHFQKPPFTQAKLIRVVSGSILDVAVDLRKDSETYGKHFKHVLSGDNKIQLYIPIGFAHGFLCLENNTIINYKCSNFYHAKSEASIRWNDADLNIDWGIENPILAEKDKLAKKFITFENPF
ncbi:MAG: dTDP-4-dehydrorhamnose 3,5-epimerase [Flavobacteriaceae bacterium]|nr:dTDP-4-dehydrorhamnose 3,5-epimerase [Flavobacteriaceae bacterium]